MTAALRRCAWDLKPVEVRITSALLPKAAVPDAFRVRRVYCVGQNYAKHALEMGAAKADPFFFAKPADSLVPEATILPYAPRTADYQHEVEMVVALGNPFNPFAPSSSSSLEEEVSYTNITPQEAFNAVYGVAIGLDMTRRDLQAVAKKAGRPWDLAKGPDAGAPIGPITPIVEYIAVRCGVSVEAAEAMLKERPEEAYKKAFSGGISLTNKGAVRQQGDMDEMTWKVHEIVAHLSTFVTLRPGDVIFTGTPEGVSPIAPGDKLVAKIEGLADFELIVGPKPKL